MVLKYIIFASKNYKKMKKRVLIINSNPDHESLGYELAQAYLRGALSANAEVKLVNLIDLKFDPILRTGYKKVQELEPDLIMIQNEIKQADHLVFVYPNWWGTYPALLKGFFDRTFLPKFAFEYQKNSPMQKKLLKGKSARIIVTLDTPIWYYWLVFGMPGHNSMKNCILKFCGINPVKFSNFYTVRNANESTRKKWIDIAENLGQQLK
jgi:NAD(P)H dehydrogenase (quinone)